MQDSTLIFSLSICSLVALDRCEPLAEETQPHYRSTAPGLFPDGTAGVPGTGSVAISLERLSVRTQTEPLLDFTPSTRGAG